MSGLEWVMAGLAAWLAFSLVKRRDTWRKSGALMVSLWFFCAGMWSANVATRLPLAWSETQIENLDGIMVSVGTCLGIAPGPEARRTQTYRTNGVLGLFLHGYAKAFVVPPIRWEREPHYRMVFVYKPSQELIRHEIIHVLLDRGGHPGWAFDNCVEPPLPPAPSP
jgi:hypothetical protein